MSDTIPTVRIVATDTEAGLYVIINEADFDAEVHTLYEGPDNPPASEPEPSAEAMTAPAGPVDPATGWGAPMAASDVPNAPEKPGK